MKTKKINTKLKLKEFSNSEWGLIYPKEISDSFDEFNYALETLQTDPENGQVLLKRMTGKFPDDHLEAYLALGYYYDVQDNLKLCREYYYDAYKIAESALPGNFNQKIDKLPWGIIENRSLLRAYYNWAEQSMEIGNLNKASKLLNFITNVNPDDNMGARYLLTICYFLQDKLNAVITLFSKYKEDYSPVHFYCLGLIYFEKSNFDKAAEYIKKGIEFFPNVALELLSESKKFPMKEYFSNRIGIISGGEVEAFEYKENFLDYWKNSRGSLEFLYELIPGIK